MSTRTGIITGTIRVNNSKSGNPRVCITLLQHEEFENFYWTEFDSQVANVIENEEFQNVPVVLETNDRGCVVGVMAVTK